MARFYQNIQLKGFDEDLKKSLYNLKFSEKPIVIRKNKFNPQSLEKWGDFFTNECKFKRDRRQYYADCSSGILDWWEISNQPDKSFSYAFATTPQPFHNDNAWFADAAEINLFYMFKQAKVGGSQIFYPISILIEDLMREEKELFDDLSSIPVIISKGKDDYFNETTILKNEDRWRIFWNFYRTQKNSPEINNMCENFFQFLDKKRTSKSIERVRLESGESLAFNDQLVLHARDSFRVSKPRERILYQSMWKV